MTLRKLLIGLVLLPVLVHAESIFEVGLRGGLAGWRASTNYVVMQPYVHGGLELAYRYHSPYYFSLRVGVTVDEHMCGFSKRNYEDSYQVKDIEKQTMQVDYKIGRLQERYSTLSVGVPVQIGATFKEWSFFAGPKVVLPLMGSWQETLKDAELSVYYPDYDNRVYESVPLGATRHFAMKDEGKITMAELPKPEWWIAAEINYTHYVKTGRNHHSFIVFGLYADVSLTDRPINRSEAESLVMLTATRDPFVPLERQLTSTVLGANRQGAALVNRCSLFDVGIKIAYAISPYNPYKANPHKCNCL